MSNASVAMVLSMMLFLSVFFSSLPLVFADYSMAHASFLPDFPGDMYYDGKVDAWDLAVFAAAFPSQFGGVN